MISLGLRSACRRQRHALTEAERRAKTDALTGVLNRRALLLRGTQPAMPAWRRSFIRFRRSCLRVSEASIEGHDSPIRMTCSIGVASGDPLGVWGDAPIAHADAAVYAAKRLGRNCVQVAIALAA
jgi:GGDEF domain-containing protein